MGRTQMRKLALLLSLLALGALGLVVFEGRDDKTTVGSETETAGDGYVNLRPSYRQGFKKSCGKFGLWSLVVIDRAYSLAEVSCREARDVMDGFVDHSLPSGWSCSGPDAYVECFDPDPATGEAENTIRARVRENVLRAAEAQAKLSPEQVQELKRAANDWASLFADRACNRYTGQPLCERLNCLRNVVNLDNCMRMSKEFQKSFADATVEDIKFKGVGVEVDPPNRPFYHLVAVKFSNGEVVVFSGPWRSCAGAAGGGCVWNVASEPDQNRRFVQAAAPRE
jgi:hypothetical protein